MCYFFSFENLHILDRYMHLILLYLLYLFYGWYLGKGIFTFTWLKNKTGSPNPLLPKRQLFEKYVEKKKSTETCYIFIHTPL